MKINSSVEIVNDTYIAAVGVLGLTPVEQLAVDQFGEPVVDVGGSFSGSLTRPGAGSPTTVAYVLPSKQYSLPSTFPVNQPFSLLDFPDDADVRAEVYRQTILTRIASARTAILARAAYFVGETVTTIS